MNIKIIIAALLVGVFMSSAHAAPPPFKEGQIAVQGSAYGLNDLKVIKRLPLSNITIYQVTKGKELGQVQKLRKQGIKAGLNFIAQATATTNDPLYSFQWHLTKIQVESAWNTTTGAANSGTTPIVVAVLDTGIVRGGPDGVNECPNTGSDIVNMDSDPTDASALSHGTHVAGTIAQKTNFDSQVSGTGVAGVAPGACVMLVKVLDDAGSGSFADIAEGIIYAVDNGAKVINMSLGVNARYRITSDSFIDPALDYAEENNVLVVAAAGNDGNRKNVSYPAIYPTVVAVGATDYADKLVRYSNKGQGLDIVAPGGDTSVDLDGDGYVDGVLQETFYTEADGGPAFGYYFLQGTSMASPHVAGVGALIYANGITSVNAVRQALYSTSKDLGSSGFDSTFGYGLVQAGAALGAPGPVQTPPDPATNPSPADLELDVATDVTLSWSYASGATSYDVYLGTVSKELTKIGDTTSTSFSPNNLAANTLYYWQVDAVNDKGITSSHEWSFTTAATITEPQCVPTASNEKGPRGSDGLDNDCDGLIDGADPH